MLEPPTHTSVVHAMMFLVRGFITEVVVVVGITVGVTAGAVESEAVPEIVDEARSDMFLNDEIL